MDAVRSCNSVFDLGSPMTVAPEKKGREEGGREGGREGGGREGGREGGRDREVGGG